MTRYLQALRGACPSGALCRPPARPVAVIGGNEVPMELTDIAVIRRLCAAHGFSLSKGLGQNFIVNPGVCPKIVEASGIDGTYGVLEIGPGIGVLTKELALRARRVVAIELDARLPALLAETLAGFSNVRIVQGDALKLDLAALIRQEFPGMKVAVCANLPYYITSPLVMKLLEDRLPLQHITVMVQREAAQRLAALPGTRGAGAVSYAVHYYACPQVLFSVQPGSFYPPPKVTSAVLRLSLHAAPNGGQRCQRGAGPAEGAGGCRTAGRGGAALRPAGTAWAGAVCRSQRPAASRRIAPRHICKNAPRRLHIQQAARGACGMRPPRVRPLRDSVGRFGRNGKADVFQNEVAAAAFRQVVYLQRLAVLSGKVGLQGAGHAVQKGAAHLLCVIHVEFVLLRLRRAGKQRALLRKAHLYKAVALLHRAREGAVPPGQLANGGYHPVRLRGGGHRGGVLGIGAPHADIQQHFSVFAAGGALALGRSA